MGTHIRTNKSTAARELRPNRNRRLAWRIAAFVFALYLIVDIGGKAKLVTQRYELYDARIRDEMRIAVISDLHDSLYGKNQSRLVAALKDVRPDAVLILGDLFHQSGNHANALSLLGALSDTFDCYFILGNHEYQSGEIEFVRASLEQARIPILDGESVLLKAGETRVRLFGIDDGHGGKPEQLRQINDAAAQRIDGVFSILAVHVPNGVESYLPYGFDLMLSGHTHGGQIVLPGILNGLYAPGQGFFPKYGGGRYDFDDQTLIISRGLARRPFWLPRLFNPPELTVVTLLPEPKAD